MTDSGPRRLDGTINSAGIETGWVLDGVTGYNWLRRTPELAPASPERIIQVADNAYLDPGSSGTFVIEIKLPHQGEVRQHHPEGPVRVQVGGQWKIQNPKGIPSCLFRARPERSRHRRQDPA